MATLITIAWFNLRLRVREWCQRQRPSLLDELNTRWAKTDRLT
jgi:hypothetical protein